MKPRHGIMGVGAAGVIHAQAVEELGEFDIVAYDPSIEARRLFQDSFPSATIHETLGDFLDEDCGSVSIATPHDTHHDLALSAIRRGRHVLLEKPACLNLAELRSLTAAAAARQVHCSTVLQHRLSDPVAWLKNVVALGLLGPPYQIEATLRCKRTDDYFADSDWRGKKNREGGTVIINQALHLIDLCTYLFGQGSIDGAILRRGRDCMDTEDAATACISFQDGSLCALSASVSTSIRWSGQLAVFGRSHFAVLGIGFPDSVERSDLPVADALRPREMVTRRERHEPHFRAVQRFMDAVRGRGETATLAEFKPTLELINQIYATATVVNLTSSGEGMR